MNILLQRKYLFTAIALLVISAGIALSYVLPEKYQTKSTVFIQRSVINDLVQGIAVTQSIDNELKVLTHSLTSRHLLLQVANALDLDAVYTTPKRVNDLIERFRKNLQVRVREKSDLFTIEYVDRDPRLARDFVNVLIQKYIEENLTSNREGSYGASRFIQEQVENFRSKLTEIERKLAEFKKQEDFAVLDDETTLINDIRTAQMDLEDIQIKKEGLQARKTLLLNERVGGENSLQAQLDTLNSKREQLLLIYTENYPEVVLLSAEIERLEKHLDSKAPSADTRRGETMDSSMVAIELNSLSRKEQQLRQYIETKRAILQGIPEKRKVLKELERDRDAYKSTYEQLVLRHGKSEVSKEMEIQDKSDTFRVVDPAFLPMKPVSPNRVKIIFLSLVAGIAIGFGVVYALDFLDPSIRSIETVHKIGLPVMAVIPQFSTREELLSRKRKNRFLFAFVSVYMLGVSAIMVFEFLKMTDIAVADELLRNLSLGQYLAGLGR